MSIAIIITILLYGVFVFYISKKAGDEVQDDATEYTVAGRNVGSIALLGTVCLSIWSALAFYGYGAGMYRGGIGYSSGFVGAYFVGLYASTIMYRLWLLGKKYNYITPGDFFEHRYNSKAFKYLVSAICVIFLIPYIAVQMAGVANGIVVTSSGQIGFWTVVIILTIYILGHVIKGGNKSIVGTDTLAGYVGVAIAVITAIVFIKKIPGSLSASTSYILETSPDTLKFTGTYSSWIGVFGLAMSAGMSIIAWPHIFIRSYMAKSEKVLQTMTIAFPVLELLAFGMFTIQGIWAGKVAYPGLEGAATDNIIPMMALEYAHPILAVLLVVGVFAFGMSTADSQLMIASSIIDHDVLTKKDDDNKSVKNTRIWLFVIMAIVLVVVKFRPPFLVTYAYQFSAPGFAQLIPALLGGLYWKKATKEGALTGTIGGLVAVLATLFIKNPVPVVHPILWGLFVNTILFIVVSLATKPEDRAIVDIHYFFDEFFKNRNNTTHKVLMVLVALVFVQLIVVTPYLPNPILFGWLPLQGFNVIIGAFELAIIGFFYAKNRLYEPDGSIKEVDEVRVSK